MQVAIVSCFSFFYQCIGSRCEISTTCIREIEVNFYLHDSCKFSTNITLNFYLNLLKVNQSKFENLFEKKNSKKKKYVRSQLSSYILFKFCVKGKGVTDILYSSLRILPPSMQFRLLWFPISIFEFSKKSQFLDAIRKEYLAKNNNTQNRNIYN